MYGQVSSGLDALGLTSECIGGGRIQHNPGSKEILVYGYSMVSQKRIIGKLFTRCMSLC